MTQGLAAGLLCVVLLQLGLSLPCPAFHGLDSFLDQENFVQGRFSFSPYGSYPFGDPSLSAGPRNEIFS